MVAGGLMLGVIRPGRAFAKLFAIGLCLALFPFAIPFVQGMYTHASPVEAALMIVVGVPALFLSLVRILFGVAVYRDVLAPLLYDLLKFIMGCFGWAFRLAGRVLSGGLALRPRV